jgi:hypothetical protein
LADADSVRNVDVWTLEPWATHPALNTGHCCSSTRSVSHDAGVAAGDTDLLAPSGRPPVRDATPSPAAAGRQDRTDAFPLMNV